MLFFFEFSKFSISNYILFYFHFAFPGDSSKCVINDGEEKLHKPSKASPINVSACEGSISIRNQAPLSHNGVNIEHGGVIWCEKSSSLNNKSSINNDDYSLSSQHRNACISISVGMDA